MTVYSLDILLFQFELVYCFMSSSNCCFLTCIQATQEAGSVVWYSHPFKNFPHFAVIHIVRSFSVVNEADIDVFLEFPYFFHELMNADNLISASSTYLKLSLYICRFSVHVLQVEAWLGEF